MISGMSKKKLIAMLRQGPLAVQERRSAAGEEVAPDIIALEPVQQLVGRLVGYGLPENVVTVALLRSTGTQWILIPPETADRCRALIDTEVVVRRRRTGMY